ncbi:MAG: PIN domain-containing protein [Chloroflexi bacterium]|nr:PIN domain-containing protein [Chloroflexota bacterium]
MAVLVDSSVFIEAERREFSLDEIFALVRPGESMAVSAIGAAELLFGFHLGAPAQRRLQRSAFADSVFEQFEILAFDIVVARRYAELWAHLRSKGTMIGLHDLMIGATALANGFDVLTHNVRDFERIPGLTVRRPDW